MVKPTEYTSGYGQGTAWAKSSRETPAEMVSVDPKKAAEIGPANEGFAQAYRDEGVRRGDAQRERLIKKYKAEDKPVKKMAKGGSASSRADGCVTKGRTKGKMV
jgi:hypothetical protein